MSKRWYGVVAGVAIAVLSALTCGGEGAETSAPPTSSPDAPTPTTEPTATASPTRTTTPLATRTSAEVAEALKHYSAGVELQSKRLELAAKTV